MKPRGSDYATLAALSLFWGSAFVAIKIALTEYQPVALVGVRLLLSIFMLLVLMRIYGEKLPRDTKSWRILIIAGLTGMAFPFVLISWAQQEIPSAMTAIIIGSTPILTMTMSHWAFHAHRITRRQAVGMLIGFAGVFALMGGPSIFEGGVSNLSKLAVLLSAIGYAFSAVMLKKVKHLTPIAGATGLTLPAAVLVIVASIFIDPFWQYPINPVALGAVGFLAIFSTCLGTILMSRLIFTVGPPFMSLNNYLVPIVAVIWGWYLFDEVIDQTTIVSMGLILGGIAIASSAKRTTSGAQS